MRRFSLLVLVPTLALPLSAAPSTAAATKTCNVVAIIAEAYQTAAVSEGYSVSCLRKAQVAAANDADIATYSNVDQVLRTAILRAGGTPRPVSQTPTAPETGGGGGRTTASGTTRSGTTTKPAPTATATANAQTLVDRPAGDGGGVPAPVIALGVVAVAAVLAAALVELRRRRS